MTHIMLDLETWGKRPGCDIRSIGAVVFDPLTWFVEGYGPKSFYVATDNPITEDGVYQIDYFWDGDGEYRKYPLTRDLETVQWWREQTEEAQAAFANPVDLAAALENFSVWLRRCDPNFIETGPYPDIRIWANGPQFDVSILDAVYHAVGLPVPWHYRAPRDMRTIMDAAGMTRDDPMLAEFNHGTYHNALDDAISQAMIVCEAYKRLGLQK